MGMFMQSVSFRRPEEKDWQTLLPQVMELAADSGLVPVSVDAEARQPFFGFVGFGCGGEPVMERLTEEISRLTGDYAVGAMCIDSDFNILMLFHGGELVNSGYSGTAYEEMEEEFSPLCLEAWRPLLLDGSREKELAAALTDQPVFAEELLMKMTALTGFPIFPEIRDEILERLEKFGGDWY